MSYHKQRWGILAVLSFYAFTVFVALHTLTPVLSLVIEDLGISHAQSGLLVAIFSLPSLLIIIPISYFVSRIGLKRLGIISISLMLAGSLLMLMVKSFPAFLFSRVIIGIGAAAVPFVGLQGVAQWFRGNRLGLAMGIYSMAMIGSTIFTLNLYSTVASHYGWMTDLWITAALVAVSLILFVLFFRLPPQYKETQVDV